MNLSGKTIVMLLVMLVPFLLLFLNDFDEFGYLVFIVYGGFFEGCFYVFVLLAVWGWGMGLVVGLY